MNRAKIFIAFTFLLAFAVCVSAQGEKPKFVWKNLQEKYESFYDIKPTIVNVSDKPIYFNCSLTETNPENLGIRLTKNVGIDTWQWNVWQCGTTSKDEEKERVREVSRIKKLRKQGKYIPAGCKLNPNEEFTFAFNKKIWDYIILGDGIMYEPYKSGKFRFALPFETVEDSASAYSPKFLVTPKEETK
jgi:hypothetical protein